MDTVLHNQTDRLAWKAEDHRSADQWLYELTPSDLRELDEAVKAVRSRGLAPPNYSAGDFPIPTFGQRLARQARQLEHGCGFFLLRGIPVDRYDLDTIKAIYWGIGVHMGAPVFQNKRGDLMTHVADQGDDYEDINTRLYTTAAAANPHNDPSDVVGLLCVRKSPEGGRSMIASAISIYESIVRDHPEHLPILHRGFPHDTRGEGTERRLDETTPDIPVYSLFEGRLSCCLNSKSSRTAREKQGRPLTDAEWAAIRCVEELAVSPDLCLGMDFRPGDIQFLNNWAVIHTRTAFRDGDRPEDKRLLLRLWLNLHEGRPLAPGMGDRFNNGSRGGVPAVQS
jgi:hypothetical protein